VKINKTHRYYVSRDTPLADDPTITLVSIFCLFIQLSDQQI